MGRYYTGDIEGKFWFGVQASDDASFFGGTIGDARFIEYVFTMESDMKSVEEGLEKCRQELTQPVIETLHAFFEENNGYTDEDIMEVLKVDLPKAEEILQWYARLELGQKIFDCLIENGTCSFEAEI